jgi:hypothetical protein
MAVPVVAPLSLDVRVEDFEIPTQTNFLQIVVFNGLRQKSSARIPIWHEL